jgi:hypothetical protein
MNSGQLPIGCSYVAPTAAAVLLPSWSSNTGRNRMHSSSRVELTFKKSLRFTIPPRPLPFRHLLQEPVFPGWNTGSFSASRSTAVRAPRDLLCDFILFSPNAPFQLHPPAKLLTFFIENNGPSL